MPRRPSIEAISAVSSPQTNAPAPSLTLILKLKLLPRYFVTEESLLLGLRDRETQASDGFGILGTAVDVCFVGADRKAGNHHSFEN